MIDRNLLRNEQEVEAMAGKNEASLHIDTGQEQAEDRSRLKERIAGTDTEASEANMKLQDDFYGNGGNVDTSPIYAGNNTPAIKINKDKE
jgi:hypothetical protein